MVELGTRQEVEYSENWDLWNPIGASEPNWGVWSLMGPIGASRAQFGHLEHKHSTAVGPIKTQKPNQGPCENMNVNCAADPTWAMGSILGLWNMFGAF